jgi:hypothetical protein
MVFRLVKQAKYRKSKRSRGQSGGNEVRAEAREMEPREKPW